MTILKTDKDIVLSETTNAFFSEMLFNSIRCWEKAYITNRLVIDDKRLRELLDKYNSVSQLSNDDSWFKVDTFQTKNN